MTKEQKQVIEELFDKVSITTLLARSFDQDLTIDFPVADKEALRIIEEIDALCKVIYERLVEHTEMLNLLIYSK